MVKRGEIVSHCMALGINQSQARRGLYGSDTGEWQLQRVRERSQNAALRWRCGKYQLVIIAPGQHALQRGACAVGIVKLRCATGIGLTCGQQGQDLVDI